MSLGEATIHDIFANTQENRFKFFLELGEHILDEFAGIKIIGQIERPEGKRTYEVLRERLTELFRSREFLDYGWFTFKENRAVMSLYFVWTGIYSYGEEQGSEYWPHVFEGLDVNYTPHDMRQCGLLFLRCLRENRGLHLFEDIGGREHVNRILLHGLIPDKYIDRFIEELIKPEFSRVRRLYKTGETILERWCRNDIQRRYPTPTPVPIRNFIRYGEPINIDVVNRFLDMAREWDGEEAVFWQQWGLPKYMVDAFQKSIKSAPEIGKRTSSSKRSFTGRPYLSFDIENSDIPVLCLPAQKVETCSSLKIHYSPLDSPHKPITIEKSNLPSMSVGGSIYLEGVNIPIQPSQEWAVNISDNSRYSVHYQFPIGDCGTPIPLFLFHTNTGKAVTTRRTSTELPSELSVVFPKDTELRLQGGMFVTEPQQLSSDWHEWQYAYCNLEKEGSFSYNGLNIRLQDQLETKLSFHEEIQENPYPKFTKFAVRTLSSTDKAEQIEFLWIPHPSEPQKNRIVKLFPEDRPQELCTKILPDNVRPPIKMTLESPKEPGQWSAEIDLKTSRFGGSRFAPKHKLVQAQYGFSDKYYPYSTNANRATS